MIKLYLFGGFRAEDHDGKALPFATNKTRALLAYLATAPGQEPTRQFLADLLWPTSTDAVALRNLRNTLARLRKSVDNPAWLMATHQGIQLLAEPDALWTDVTSFDYLWQHLHTTTALPPLQEVLSTLAADDQVCYRINGMREAVALYQGEFLAGLFWPEDDSGAFRAWQRQKQEEYHIKVLSLLDQLIAHGLTIGDYAAAIDDARRQLRLEPWREQTHRQVIVALAATGDYSGALVQYEICRQTVRDEWGTEPEAETHALFQQIQAERQQQRQQRSTPIGLPPTPAAFDAPPAALAPHKPRHNLPPQLTPFIGRANEIAQLYEALQSAAYRLHVVVGMGGMGKSRLALQVAAMALAQIAEGRFAEGRFADGIFRVPLADVATVDAVVPAIARALAIPIQDKSPLYGQLLAYLQDRHLLLVLDNVEHLLDEGEPDPRAFATLLLALLHNAPHLVLVVTSRRQLHVRAENLFLLDGLAYPTAALPPMVPPTMPPAMPPTMPSGMIDVTALQQYDAINLFVEYAQRVKKDFSLANEAPAVLQICQLLQGLPLGIELAAAYVQQLDCATILADLTHNLANVQSTVYDIPPRQRSLLAVFDFSWRLLPVHQQALLARCAIFQGGFALADVCALMPEVEAAALHELVAHSLVQQQADGRFGFHALVQQCAGQMSMAGALNREMLAASHSHYFLHKLVAWRAEFYSLTLPDRLAAVAQDWANLHRAWQWAVQHGQIAWLDAALDGFHASYYFRHHHEEGIHFWQETAVAVAQACATLPAGETGAWQRFACRLQIKVTRHLSALQHNTEVEALLTALQATAGLAPDLALEVLLIESWILGTFDEAHSQRCAELSRLVDNPQLLGEYWCQVASKQREQGKVTEAMALGWQALEFYQSCADYAGQILARRGLAITCMHLNQLAEAQSHLQAALAWATDRADMSAAGGLYEILGIVQSRLGDHGAAIHAFTNELEIARQVGQRCHKQTMLLNLALEYALLGKYAEARRRYEALLPLLCEEFPNNGRLECYARLNLCLLYHTIGEQQAALPESERALALARKLGVPYLEGYALTNLGHIYCAVGCYPEAEAAYRAALALREQLGETSLALETAAGLARLAFTCGQLAAAQEWIAPILAHLSTATLAGAEEPFRVYLTCHHILSAAGDSRAAPLAAQIQQELQQQADLITDPTLRRSFLTEVPYHRLIMAINGPE